MTSPSIPDVLLSYEFLAEIDFIRAKALFSEQITGLKPAFENEQVIDWTMEMCIRDSKRAAQIIRNWTGRTTLY